MQRFLPALATVLLFSSLSPSGAVAQQRPALRKLDAQLRLWIADPSLVPGPHLGRPNDALIVAAPTMVSVIFRTTSDAPRAIVERHGGTVHSVLGTICTADLPLTNIMDFAAEPAIVRIESGQAIRLHNDDGRRSIGADKVNDGHLPDGIGYTGAGVIVGVVDTGLDFLHPDFRRRSDTTDTRILSLWDQTSTDGVAPQDFPYGSEWTAAQVRTELQSAPGIVTERDSAGHGTHVMGTAGGRRGVAYDADLISVKTHLVGNGDYTFSSSPRTLDAINYVYREAVRLNRPAVVNLSLGFVFGAPHDGTSLFEQGIDYLVDSRPGFIVCASAGNEGLANSHHGGYRLSGDTVWTYVNGLNGATWYGVNDAIYDDSLSVAVSIDTARVFFRTGIVRGQGTAYRTPWFRMKDLKDSLGGIRYAVADAHGDTTATLHIVASDYDDTRTEWYIYPRDRFVLTTDSVSTPVHLYRIHVMGHGSFHAWTQALNGFGMNVLQYSGTYRDAAYRPSDNLLSVGIPATAHKVLAVGAYVNKPGYTDINGIPRTGLNTARAPHGVLAPFSSVGPTLDQRVKPEITAPGLNVASSLSRYAVADSAAMIDPYTAVFSGTSMSCPFTTGAVALYLERNPRATFDQVRTALMSSARHDAYTEIPGPLPNPTWGAGKLDIFAAMGGVTTSVDVQGRTADDGTVAPNPATTEVTITVPRSVEEYVVEVVDPTGRRIAERTVPAGSGHLRLDVDTWGGGVYAYRLMSGGGLRCGTFVVRR